MPCNEIAAIIPASGRGERFGGPKAGASLGAVTFLERILSTLKDAGITDLFVAQDYDTPDMLATLRRAISELGPHHARAYLIFPVDHPFVQPATVRSLRAAWNSNPDAIFRPAYRGQPGHPVIIPAWLDLERDDGGNGLAGIIRAQVCSVIDVPVEDPEILRNVNYPKDLEN